MYLCILTKITKPEIHRDVRWYWYKLWFWRNVCNINTDLVYQYTVWLLGT